MTKLEKKLEQRKTLLKKFEAFKQLRTTCLRLQMHYYRNGNAPMVELMEERLSKVVNQIEIISIALKPLNAIALAEYKKSDVHQFLMKSKGMNGRDILIKNKIQ